MGKFLQKDAKGQLFLYVKMENVMFSYKKLSKDKFFLMNSCKEGNENLKKGQFLYYR